MRQASLNRINRLARRALRRQQLAARMVLSRLDPKSIERSTMAGIGLFAASSIALQGFVVAQGSISGRTSGFAQAAIVPTKAQLASAFVADDKPAAPRQDLDVAAIRPLARGDKLERLTSDTLSGHGKPRIADVVPADTILAKPLTAADLGLRTRTFEPATMRGASDEAQFAMRPRIPNADVMQRPMPTRVAYLGGAANSLGNGIVRSDAARDRVQIIESIPPSPASRAADALKLGVPKAVIEKVHFQSDTPNRCLPTELMNVIYDVAERFGDVQVLSTFRDPERNRRVGGAPQSFHLRCQAIDFRVTGRQPGLLDYLEQRADVGGVKRYPLGFYHIDTGPRRTW